MSREIGANADALDIAIEWWLAGGVAARGTRGSWTLDQHIAKLRRKLDGAGAG